MIPLMICMMRSRRTGTAAATRVISLALLAGFALHCHKSRPPMSEFMRSAVRDKARETQVVMVQAAAFIQPIPGSSQLPGIEQLAAQFESANPAPRPSLARKPGAILDAWGTPLRYETLEDGKSYRLVSAGADAVFEAHTVPPLGERYERTWTDTAEEDLVYENGVWMRDLGDEVGLPPEGRAVVRMNQISSACDYKADGQRYPRAESIEELSAILIPHYASKVSAIDPWGSPFVYIVSGDSRSFRIVSAGPDRKLHESSKLPPGSPRTRGNDDIVMEGHKLVEPL